MNAHEITKVVKETKKSGQNKLAKKFHAQSSVLEQEALQGSVAALVKKRDENAQNRKTICESVKMHGGPSLGLLHV